MKSDILRKRFGQSRLLNLEALEWLESTMHAKTVRFDIGFTATQAAQKICGRLYTLAIFDGMT